MFEFLRIVEKEHPVADIRAGGRQAWPILRMAYWWANVERVSRRIAPPLPPAATPRPGIGDRLRRLGELGYGGIDWLRRYPIVAFGTSAERREVAGELWNVLLDPIAEAVGPDEVLLIELPRPRHPERSRSRTRHVVSAELPSRMAALRARLPGAPTAPIRIEGADILTPIKMAWGLEVDDEATLARHEAERRRWSRLFAHWRPTTVITSDYYSNLPVVHAAKERGARVVEVQHGLIGDSHEAYHVDIDLEPYAFPDELVLLGTDDLDNLRTTRLLPRERMHVAGSFYVEHVRTESRPLPEIDRFRDRFEMLVGVTLDWITERRVIELVIAAARLEPRACWILLPRRMHRKSYSDFELPPNVVLAEDLDVYRALARVDFHATVGSTCALEAPSLGAANLLVDIEGLSREYFGTKLDDPRYNRLVTNPAEAVAALAALSPLPPREEIVRWNRKNIEPGYGGNLERVLGELGLLPRAHG